MPDKKSALNSRLESASDQRGAKRQKIAMIVAYKDFRDEEYFTPKEIFENAGATVETVSSEAGTARGADGGEVLVDLILEDLKPEEYDAIVFIGGPGAQNYMGDKEITRITQRAADLNKIIGAICIAPAIVAKTGILKEKRATVWSSPLDKSMVKVLEASGVIYEAKDVVVDGKIVTGNGPKAAKKFAEAIVEVLRR